MLGVFLDTATNSFRATFYTWDTRIPKTEQEVRDWAEKCPLGREICPAINPAFENLPALIQETALSQWWIGRDKTPMSIPQDYQVFRPFIPEDGILPRSVALDDPSHWNRNSLESMYDWHLYLQYCPAQALAQASVMTECLIQQSDTCRNLHTSSKKDTKRRPSKHARSTFNSMSKLRSCKQTSCSCKRPFKHCASRK